MDLIIKTPIHLRKLLTYLHGNGYPDTTNADMTVVESIVRNTIHIRQPGEDLYRDILTEIGYVFPYIFELNPSEIAGMIDNAVLNTASVLMNEELFSESLHVVGLLNSNYMIVREQ